MKKLALTIIIPLVIVGTTMAQISEEAFQASYAIQQSWQNGKTEEAVDSSLVLYELSPMLFEFSIHNTLVPKLKRDRRQHGLNYLEKMTLEGNQEINDIIGPIYLWSKAMAAEDEQELMAIKEELQSLQKDCPSYNSRQERYNLMTIKELDKKKAIDTEQRTALIKKNISCLKNYPYITDRVPGGQEGGKRAWYRYLLAYSYYYLYSTVSEQEEYLKKAADFSPDLSDRLYPNAYMGDARLLADNIGEIGYKATYQKYLADNDRQAEALDLLVEITFLEPSHNNIKALREYYAKVKSEESFKSFWEDYIHSQGKAAPPVKIEFKNKVLDLTQKPETWIFIDVWGTWCAPCIEELPQIQSFYDANQEKENSKLKIFTLSYGSQNLWEFMDENNYTFPVSEIDKETNDLFEVSGYPTKILISPQGNFIKIPFGVSWKTYIKNYTLP